MKGDLQGSVHFVGIGGIGLSGLARLLKFWGWQVSGSDRQASDLTRQLAGEGIAVHVGHDAGHLGDAALVVVSSAIAPDNPEVQAAHRLGRPVIKRDELLRRITTGKRCVAIAGTHGKTTTTAMTGLLLAAAGLDPTVIVGGIVPAWKSNVRLGHSDLVVIEADEYDHAFLGLHPAVAVITTIELDHPDIYANLDEVVHTFGHFLSQVQAGGLIVAHTPEDSIDRTLASRPQPVALWRYGIKGTGDWQATTINRNARGGNDFRVQYEGRDMGKVTLAVPGLHNVCNALAALAVARRLTSPSPSQGGGAWEKITHALTEFRGVERRLQRIGMERDVLIIDDYAHHPTEVRATLSALRERDPRRPVWAIFQPHTFSRTKALFDQFATCFDEADHVFVTDIYAAREQDDGTIHARSLVAAMQHADARYTGSLDQTLAQILNGVRAGDTVVTLGAGDVTTLGLRLRNALQKGKRGTV